MPRKNRVNLSVYDNVKRRIQQRKKQDDPQEKFSLTEWVSDYLMMNIEQDDFLKKYTPFLKLVGVDGNKMTLQDDRTKQIAEVYLKDKRLFCDLDSSADCLHVQFALAIPECSRLATKDSL